MREEENKKKIKEKEREKKKLFFLTFRKYHSRAITCEDIINRNMLILVIALLTETCSF